MKGFIVDIEPSMYNDKQVICVFGRSEDNKSFLSMHDFTPYFFIRESDVKKAGPLLSKFAVEKTKETNFDGEKTVKILGEDQAELNKLAQALHKKEIDTYEADIKPAQRFIIDNNLLGSIELQGDSQPSEKIDRVFLNPNIKPSDKKIDLKIVSLDIESDKKLDNLFCIGLYSENYKKNFMITDQKIDHVVNCKDERDLLTKFKEEMIKLDPDIITGWHVIDFDLSFLKKKFAENKINFDIGRTNEAASVRIESGFFKASTADVPGRQVLDALSLIKDPFIKEAPSIKNKHFDSYTLEDVSQEILGETKTITGKDRHEELDNLFYNKNHKKLAEYNIQDCKLVYDMLKKTDIIGLAVERSMLTGALLNKITASISAFDSLYIREARKNHLVSPTTRFSNKEERITGGYVMDSKPGLYHNVLVLDYKSLYPSVMKTLNIDPASHLKNKEKGAIETVNKAYFKNQNGILPQILEKLHQAREKAKKEKREFASYAIKIIMNSFFGVLANPNCRYFSLEVANAITHSARFIIKLTAEKIEEMGYKVIYSDTDSVFIETNLPKDKANKLGIEIQNKINSFFEEYMQKNHNRKSVLELQFAKQYIAFLMPSVRDSEKGSKKRYAGLIEENGKENIEIVGLEAIRGDWTEAAQDFQKKLLDKIFHKEEFTEFIKKYVDEIKKGKLDDKLIYRKSIRKSLEKYTKTTPPHVKAARQLDTLDSNIIKYVITVKGPEPIQKLKSPIDYDHYIEKQIKPIANVILALFKKEFDEIMQAKQTKLF